VPFNFYNSKNISRAGLASGRSLIEQIALYCCKRCDFAIYLPSTMAISSSVARKARINLANSALDQKSAAQLILIP
jgi:hypothetical protein